MRHIEKFTPQPELNPASSYTDQLKTIHHCPHIGKNPTRLLLAAYTSQEQADETKTLLR